MYQEMTNKGKNPYWKYNKADAWMVKELGKIDDPTIKEFTIKLAAKSVWKVKEFLTGERKKEKEKFEEGFGNIKEAVMKLRGSKKRKREEEFENEWVEEEDERSHLEQKTGHEDPPDEPRDDPMADEEEPWNIALPEDDEDESLSDLQGEATMSCDGNGGAGQMNTGGGEMSVEPMTNIWRGFSNTQNAALRWIYSNFLTTSANNAEQTAGYALGSEDATMPVDASGITSNTNIAGAGVNPSAHTLTNIVNTGLPSLTKGYDFSVPFLIQLRMTSPYDILKNFGGTVGSNTSVGAHRPIWLSKFDDKYTYYNVQKTKWSMHFNFASSITTGGSQVTGGQDVAIYVFWRYTCEDDPPTAWNYTTAEIANANVTNTANGLTTVGVESAMTGGPYQISLTPDDYMRMGHWSYKRVVLNSTKPTSCHIGGTYHFGQCKMDIKTISTSDKNSNSVTAEEWAKTSNVPVFPENLSVIVVYDNATVPAKMFGKTNEDAFLLPAGVRMETENYIQFKDLSTPYKYPTPAYCITGSSSVLNGEVSKFTTASY